MTGPAEILAVALDWSEEHDDYPVELRARIASLLPRLRIGVWREITGGMEQLEVRCAVSGRVIGSVRRLHDANYAGTVYSAAEDYPDAVAANTGNLGIRRAPLPDGNLTIEAARLWVEAELQLRGWVVNEPHRDR